MLIFKFIIFLSIFFISNNSVEAHPGNTAGDGCHYCRTNCDDWGVEWDERHCHSTDKELVAVEASNDSSNLFNYGAFGLAGLGIGYFFFKKKE